LLIGSALLIAASVRALRWTMIPRLVSDLSVAEVTGFTADRFIEEVDLWRVQLRMIRGLARAIESTGFAADRTAQAIESAQRYFFGGLSLIGVSLGTLVVVVAF